MIQSIFFIFAISRSRIVPAAIVAAAIATAVIGRSGEDEETQTVATLTFPSSDAFPTDEFHARRALLGGTLAGAAVAVTQGGTCYATSFSHGGARANPVTFDPDFAGCEHEFAALSAGNQTCTAVATAAAAGLEAAGATDVVADGCELTVGGATASIVGDPMASAIPAVRGMWGAQRLNFGGSDGGVQNGNTGGTGSVHAPCPTVAGRVRGMYMRGRANGGTWQPRLAFGTGPAYSTDPGAITVHAQGRAGSASDNNELYVVIFADPVLVSPGECWFIFRSNSGQIVYRDHADEGFGDLTEGGVLVWDTTASNDPTVAVASSYDPTANNTFNLYPHIGMLWEPEVGGGYPGDGSLDTWVGNLREVASEAANGGTVAQTLTAEMVDEAVGFRMAMPNWTGTTLTQTQIALSAWTASEDVGLAFYQFLDTVIPSAEDNPLLVDIGPFGTSATGWNTHTLVSPLGVGTDALGNDPIVAPFVNAGALNGAGTLGTLRILYDDETNGVEYWPTLWVDEGREWDDRIAPAETLYGTAAYPMLGPITEYRSLGSFGTTNPVGDPNDPWPDPLGVDNVGGGTQDDGPRNLMRLRVRLRRGGITASVE